MLRRLLSINIFVFWACMVQAQTNRVSIGLGTSFRISDRAVFGLNTSEGRHKDMPDFTHKIAYQRKIMNWKNKHTFYATCRYQSTGVVGKKLYFPKKPDPNWGGTINDAYYRKYGIRFQNFQLGITHKMPLSDKISLTSTLVGNYLFRINSKIKTKYPSNDEFRTFGKSKYSSSVIPDKEYNRAALVAEIGVAYRVFEHADLSVSLGSFVTNLYDKEETRQSTLFPIWLDVGYGYSF